MTDVLIVRTSDGSLVSIPNDGREYRSHWGRSVECNACYVGKQHSDCR